MIVSYVPCLQYATMLWRCISALCSTVSNDARHCLGRRDSRRLLSELNALSSDKALFDAIRCAEPRKWYNSAEYWDFHREVSRRLPRTFRSDVELHIRVVVDLGRFRPAPLSYKIAYWNAVLILLIILGYTLLLWSPLVLSIGCLVAGMTHAQAHDWITEMLRRAALAAILDQQRRIEQLEPGNKFQVRDHGTRLNLSITRLTGRRCTEQSENGNVVGLNCLLVINQWGIRIFGWWRAQ